MRKSLIALMGVFSLVLFSCSTARKGGIKGDANILLDNKDTKEVVSAEKPSTTMSSTTAVQVTNTTDHVLMPADDDKIVPASSESSMAKFSTSSAAESGEMSEIIGYDTIGKSRFLRTMAKDFYGNPEFWPYIYEENSNKLGDPDRIRPGSVIKIPSLVKYGVNTKNPADVEKAKKLGKEIYARYGK